MKKQDKIIAIVGVILIIVLAIVAILLLFNIKNSSGMISVVPQKEKVEISVVEDEKSKEVKDSSTDDYEEITVKESAVKTGSKTANKSEDNGKYTKPVCRQIKNNDNQLKELAGYWEEYRLDAVGDLIRLERIKAFTNELSGTNEYFYCGDVDENNIPNGRGLAVYADNTYYYGDWVKGVREGTGMWLRIYPDKPGKEGLYTGVLEHQYNGAFKNDLPNGEGQEHYSFKREDISYTYTIANAIGGFKNGYYDGEMLLMTDNGTASYLYSWNAIAKSGSFVTYFPNKVGSENRKAVWQKTNDNDHSNDEHDEGYYWMKDDENKDFGIYGLKK